MSALPAATDWEAAVAALRVGELPSSGGERRMLLLAASIAGGTSVSLNDTLTGVGRRNASLVVNAVAHAAGLPDPRLGTALMTAASSSSLPPSAAQPAAHQVPVSGKKPSKGP